jgi:hypothetical protein
MRSFSAFQLFLPNQHFVISAFQFSAFSPELALSLIAKWP